MNHDICTQHLKTSMINIFCRHWALSSKFNIHWWQYDKQSYLQIWYHLLYNGYSRNFIHNNTSHISFNKFLLYWAHYQVFVHVIVYGWCHNLNIILIIVINCLYHYYIIKIIINTNVVSKNHDFSEFHPNEPKI